MIHEVLADPDSTGILLTGVPGIGKQGLIQSLPELVGSDRPTVKLLCSAMLSATPYGALAPILSGGQNASSDVAALRQIFMVVRSILEGYPAGVALFIVVEEAQFIDSASAFVLGQLVHSGLAKLVVISTGKHMDSISFDELLNGAGLKHIDLGKLEVNGTKELCSLLLQGRVTMGTAKIITEQTNGNPYLVRCFIEAAQRQRLLVEHRGYWVLSNSEPEPDAILREAVRELHRRHGSEEQEAMELLCLAGNFPTRDLRTITGLDLEYINPSSLIRLDAEDASMASGFYASVLRVAIPPGRNRELRSKYRDVCGTGGARFYKQVLWDIESGESPDSQDIISSAKQANDRGAHHVAWELIQAYPSEAASADIAVERIRALFGQADVHGTPHLLTESLLTTADEKASGALREARKVARWILSRSRINLPAGLGGEIDQAESDLVGEPLISSVDAKFIALIERSSHEFAAGKTGDAWETAAAHQAVEGTAFFRPVRYRLALAVLAARAATSSGEYGKAHMILEDFQFANPMDVLYAHGSLQLCVALNELYQGKIHEAHLAIGEAISELEVADPEDLLGLALGINAYLAKIHAENVGSSDTSGGADEYVSVPLESISLMPGGSWKESDDWLGRIYRELSVDEPQAGFLQGALDSLALLPNRAVEREALYLCWSAGISDELRRNAGIQFTELIGPKPCKRQESQGRLIELATRGDIGQLKSFASLAYACDEKVCAIEALAHIVGLLSEEGSEREQGFYLRQLDEWLGDFGGQPWGLVAETLATRGLTSREWEIVNLVRTGMSNKEIASHLTVSQRTVEGHLYRIFAKRGMRTRHELSELKTPSRRP